MSEWSMYNTRCTIVGGELPPKKRRKKSIPVPGTAGGIRHMAVGRYVKPGIRDRNPTQLICFAQTDMGGTIVWCRNLFCRLPLAGLVCTSHCIGDYLNANAFYHQNHHHHNPCHHPHHHRHPIHQRRVRHMVPSTGRCRIAIGYTWYTAWYAALLSLHSVRVQQARRAGAAACARGYHP